MSASGRDRAEGVLGRKLSRAVAIRFPKPLKESETCKLPLS